MNATTYIVDHWTGTDTEWDNLVFKSPSPHLLQSSSYARAKERSGSKIIFLKWVDKHENIIAIGTAIIRKKIGLQIAFFPRGPIFLEPLIKILVKNVYTALRSFCKSSGIIWAKVAPTILLEEATWYDNTINSANVLYVGSRNIHARTSVVQLSSGVDSVLKSFESRLRYSIRKSDMEGVVISQGANAKNIDAYCLLAGKTSERGGFSIKDQSFYSQFLGDEFNQFSRLYVLYKDDVPLAAAIVLTDGGMATYLWGASARAPKKFSPGAVLHWEIIKKLIDENVKTYDLQGIPLYPNEKDKNWGVYLFKRGFKGQEKTYVPETDIFSSSIISFILTVILGKRKKKDLPLINQA